jgi:hypothetical protein
MTPCFTFVVADRVPADNTAAEGAVRPVASCREISGGTRSPRNSETMGIFAALSSTWRLQGTRILHACRQMLLAFKVSTDACPT